MKKLSLIIGMFLLFGSSLFSQVGINSDNLPPDASAGLDVKFTDKGFLPPRVELQAPYNAAPIVSPAVGLLVYNTANAGNPPDNVVPGYYYWNGVMWNPFVVSSGTNGQTLRNDGSNWVANSVLYNDGTKIGIGVVNPTHKLTIAGTDQTLRLIGPGAWGSTARLNFGDENFVSISEDIDDNLLIHSRLRTAITGGNVGIGTTNPGHLLTVAGTIQSSLGGVMFPDNTIQTTAAVPNNIHTIGETYGGGKVFYVFDGGQHGLIAATTDQGSAIKWNINISGVFSITNAVKDGIFSGYSNTERIIINQGVGNYAAQICANYQGGGYGDWYLPSKAELNLLYLQKDVVGGFGINPVLWSSTEATEDWAWIQNFSTGGQSPTAKSSSLNVRAIRAF